MMSETKNVVTVEENPCVKTRYNDEELHEFKEIILARLEKANFDLEQLKSAYVNESGNGTDDTSPSHKTLEDGQKTLCKEENSKYAERQIRFIRDLNNALTRIENKTYGIDRETGKLISKERLRAVPITTRDIGVKIQNGSKTATVSKNQQN